MEQKTTVFENRLLKYSFAAGTLLATASSVNGQIAYTDVIPDYTIPGNGSYTIDFSNNEFQIRSHHTSTTSVRGFLSENTTGGAWIKRSIDRPKALASQYVISASKSFANNHASSRNRLFWAVGSSSIMDFFMDGASFKNATKFLGVKFKIGANTHYGWIKIYTNSNGVMTISEYAYETSPGVGIKAGEKTVSLPVELTTFEAILNSSSTDLKWETATEVNNYGFDIERSVISNHQAENWTKIGFVQGNGTTNSQKEYSFNDENLPDATEVKYRLKQIDNDGTFAYSKELTVDLSTITAIEDEINNEFALGQNYPNPFNPSTTINFSLAESGNVKLTVFNSLGQEVKTLLNKQMSLGKHQVDFNASNLPSGLYTYRIDVDGKYNATKKMLLIK